MKEMHNLDNFVFLGDQILQDGFSFIRCWGYNDLHSNEGIIL